MLAVALKMLLAFIAGSKGNEMQYLGGKVPWLK
jgi:hypothetical protein